jgi:hypothetical protein
MRFLRNLILVLMGLIALLAAGAYLLPRHQIVERSILIDASPEAVFPLVNSLKRGAEWSPWMGRDPAMQVTYEGPDDGVGAKMQWASENPQVGSGRQEIVLSTPNERVETALDFGEMGAAKAWFALASEGEGTRLVWGLDADMGSNPIGRWMGLMMDRWVGADYEAGLANIKALAEGG